MFQIISEKLLKSGQIFVLIFQLVLDLIIGCMVAGVAFFLESNFFQI
jgi:hypothetical protein